MTPHSSRHPQKWTQQGSKTSTWYWNCKTPGREHKQYVHSLTSILLRFSLVLQKEQPGKKGQETQMNFFFFRTKKYTDGQQAHGKMLNITPYWGDARQNHSEISPHIWQNGYPTKYYRQQVKMWRKGNPCALLMGTSIGTTAMENYTEVLKQNTILWSTAEHFSKENKNMKKIYAPLCSCSSYWQEQR